VRGSHGNTASLLARAAARLPTDWQSDPIALAEYGGTIDALAERLLGADAFLIGSGVYWGSWGSPLQRFLELISAHELSPVFLGKPAGAIVSADSVGGLDVAQRLLGAFSLLGCFVPPLSSLVISRVGLEATRADARANEDVWQLEDLGVVVRNLVLAQSARSIAWSTWPVRQLNRAEGSFTAPGMLEQGLEKFL
jgi:NAD(P)H-dependent FMN reductase